VSRWRLETVPTTSPPTKGQGMSSKEWPPCTQNQRNKMTQERNPNKPTRIQPE